MKESLKEYMTNKCSKHELLAALRPATRTIHMKILQDSVLDTIESILSLARNSIEHHCQSISIVFEGTTKPLLFPNFSEGNSAKKIAILFSLLQAIGGNLRRNQIRTIRDVYYSNVELYAEQRNVERCLSTIAKTFQLSSRDFLNVIPAQKGLCYTTLEIAVQTNGVKTSVAKNSTALIPYMNQDSQLKLYDRVCTGVVVVVLEKEAVFNKLVERFKKEAPYGDFIVLTGKGYPDFLTRVFLNKLQIFASCIKEWNIYTDSDPHGLDIALKYIQNDQNPSYKCELLKYRGIRLSQLLTSSSVQFLRLSQRDISLAIKLLHKLICTNLKQKELFICEVQRQLFFHKKAEMNVVESSFFL